MTAVAGSSNKVGGPETQIVTVRPLERSVHLRTAISCSAAVSLAATIFFSRIARIELVTATTRTGRTSNTGLPRSRSRSPLRARSVASSVQRSPRARNSCRRAFLLRELRTRSLSFSVGTYRDVMQLGASTPSAMRLEGPEPRHELTLVYRQECPEIVRHSIKSRRTTDTALGVARRRHPHLAHLPLIRKELAIAESTGLAITEGSPELGAVIRRAISNQRGSWWADGGDAPREAAHLALALQRRGRPARWE